MHIWFTFILELTFFSLSLAVVNQGYNTTDEVIGTSHGKTNTYTDLNKSDIAPAINHQYKSLKKPNEDLGSDDYADPEKYTEPPVLPERNSKVIDDENKDAEEGQNDYLSQEPPTSTKATIDKELAPEEPTSGEYLHVNGTSLPKASGQQKIHSDNVGVDDDAVIDDDDVPQADSENANMESDYIDM
jgi:hypothetical protein